MLIEIVVIILIIISGFSLNQAFSSYIKYEDKINLNYLWVYHFMFGVIFWWYIFHGPGGDGVEYYRVAKEYTMAKAINGYLISGPGTFAMNLWNVPLATFLSSFGLSMVYCLLGYIGIVFFYVLFVRQIKYNVKIYGVKLFPFIFFLPNLHFWSAGISKDAILFLCVAVFIYSMQNARKYFFLVFLSLLFSYLVRPHITLFLLLSFFLGFIMDGKLKLYQKFIIVIIAIVGFFLLFDSIMTFLQIDSLDSKTIDKYTATSVERLSGNSGSAVDISDYPLVAKVLTFLYRPLFFDINNVLAVIASFENLILVILTVKFLKSSPITNFFKGSYMLKSILIFVVIGSISFSLILGNLGIMLRQKNMFLIPLIFVCMVNFSIQIQKSENKLLTDIS